MGAQMQPRKKLHIGLNSIRNDIACRALPSNKNPLILTPTNLPSVEEKKTQIFQRNPAISPLEKQRWNLKQT